MSAENLAAGQSLRVIFIEYKVAFNPDIFKFLYF
jgi:hypothetical protein